MKNDESPTQPADEPVETGAGSEDAAGRPVTSSEFLAGAAYDFWEDF